MVRGGDRKSEKYKADHITLTPLIRKKNDSARKAIQVAFDLDKEIGRAIRTSAAAHDLTPSAQIRNMLDLPIKMPKRPRLTTSLNGQDYQTLGQRFGIDPDDTIAIRHRIVKELTEKMKD